MPTVNISITAPVEKVFAYVTDPLRSSFAGSVARRAEKPAVPSGHVVCNFEACDQGCS
jgi:hypothetical protein